nr:CDGSH iron-sulfur domain-containing protein [Oceanococcus sp. HetDA_MAG_MS8]
MKTCVQALRKDQPARPVSLPAGTHLVCGCEHAQSADGLCRAEAGCQGQGWPITLKRPQLLWLCSCGRSANMPYCDQSHQKPEGL